MPNLNRRTFAGSAITTFAALALPAAPHPPRLEMTVLNPISIGGAGLCVILRTPGGKTYLFDTANGAPNHPVNNGRDLIVPWLASRGIRKIDGLILSHYHSDHFGGLFHLADHIEIAHVFDNSYEPLCGLGNPEIESGKRLIFDWERAHPGQVTRYLTEGVPLGWNEPDLAFDVVWPPRTGYCTPLASGPDRKRNGSVHHLLNANSNALRIRFGTVTFLILGDINCDYVNAFMRPYMERKGTWNADVAVLHCHGIADDDGVQVAAMNPRPRVVIASLGTIPWMFGAARRSVACYTRRGFTAFATNLHGDVTVTTDGRTVETSADASKRHPPAPPLTGASTTARGT